MSLAATQRVSSAAFPVNEPVFAALHVHLNYWARKKNKKKPSVCF